MTVSDAGRWKAPSPTHKGLGLTVMRGLMDAVDLETGLNGTTVEMRRRLPVGGRT